MSDLFLEPQWLDYIFNSREKRLLRYWTRVHLGWLPGKRMTGQRLANLQDLMRAAYERTTKLPPHIQALLLGEPNDFLEWVYDNSDLEKAQKPSKNLLTIDERGVWSH